MATDLISPHEVRLLLVFRQRAGDWLTNNAVAKAAEISPRTARAHTDRLVRLGVLEEQQVYPGPVFRLAGEPGEEAQGYLQRAEKAREIFRL
jgi:hypothetical protein